MAEEEKKPEAKQEEKQPEQKQAQAKPEQEQKQEKAATEPPAAEKKKPPAAEKKEAAAKKKKKINRLTLKELEKKIAETQEKMGSLTSAYAQQLLKRKEQLLSEGEKSENE